MKNKLKYFILILLLSFVPKTAFAASASLSCGTSSSSVTVGSPITVTFTGNSNGISENESLLFRGKLVFDSTKLQYDGSTSVWIDTKPYRGSYTFYAINPGTAEVYVNDLDISGNDTYNTSPKSGVCSINVVSPSSNNSNSGSSSSSTNQNITRPEKSNLSSDNSLKSLKIDGVELSPEFKSDVLEYDGVFLTDEKTEIKIDAEVNDENASIKGIGTKEVDLGFSKFEIEVEAENGSTRVYTINLVVNEKNPIKVNVGGKKYTLMRKIDGISIPSGFEKSTITIDDKEVDVFKYNKYVIVVLIDENNDNYLYLYDNGKYTSFKNIKSNSLNLVVLDEKVNIPHRYRKISFNINNESVNGYVFDLGSDFRLVYALNLETNEKGFYLYDLKENTFQRFYNEQVLIYIDLIQKCKIAFIVAGGVILLFFFIIVCQKVSYKKIKKKINNYNINEDIEKQIQEKSKEKEKKPKKKKEKTFLDE